MNPTILIFQGIAPAHQNCLRAFDDMANVLDSLKVYPGFRDLVSPDDVKCLLKAIVDARIYINFFKGYKIRSTITRRTWSGLKQEATDSDAFMLFDFPMKFMLQQFRGTTTGWFARVS